MLENKNHNLSESDSLDWEPRFLGIIFYATYDISLATVRKKSSRKPSQERAEQIHKLHFGIPWEVGIYNGNMHLIPRKLLWGLCHIIPCHCFLKNKDLLWRCLCLVFKPRIRRKLCIPYPHLPSLMANTTMANRRDGRNKQSLEEGSPLHFVLISLVALGQNCLLQK